MEALALRFKSNDKLVCHVAMFKCSMALNAALASFEADKFRTGYIERTYCVVEVWVLQRMRVEKAFADAALLPFKAAGYRFEDSVCLSKPCGSENSGPEWSIETVASSVTPAIH